MPNPRTVEEARAAKAAALKAFSAVGDVVGVGIARMPGGYGIKVNLASALPAGVKVPESVEGVPVKVEVVGRIRKRG